MIICVIMFPACFTCLLEVSHFPSGTPVLLKLRLLMDKLILLLLSLYLSTYCNFASLLVGVFALIAVCGPYASSYWPCFPVAPGTLNEASSTFIVYLNGYCHVTCTRTVISFIILMLLCLLLWPSMNFLVFDKQFLFWFCNGCCSWQVTMLCSNLCCNVQHKLWHLFFEQAMLGVVYPWQHLYVQMSFWLIYEFQFKKKKLR